MEEKRKRKKSGREGKETCFLKVASENVYPIVSAWEEAVTRSK